jgi:hypothetical protein
LQGILDQAALLKAREGNDPYLWVALKDCPRSGHAIHARHHHVHQHHIWSGFFTHAKGFLATASFGHQLYVVKGKQRVSYATPDHGVVIDNDNTD